MHDSLLESWSVCGETLVLSLRAYVHTSDGKPGIDAGTGWTQTALIHLLDSHVEGKMPDSDAAISDGELRLDAEVSSN